jgi:hypothetical protein
MLLALLFAAADPAITVTATPLRDAQIDEQARVYVRSVLPTPRYGQYARWAEPVCIKLAGLDDAVAERVSRRIVAAAEDARVPVAKAGCKPNLTIVFSEDAAATIRAIVRNKPRTLAQLGPAERNTLLTAPLPVRWWYGYELRDRDGQRAVPNGSAALMSASVGGGKPLIDVLPVGPDTAMTDSRSSSLIASSVAIWATSAVVIVDVTLATGKSLDAVADYAALAALAPMKLPPPAPGVPSILSLFDSPEASTVSLSRWDRAWLAALYRIPMARKGDRQRGDIAARMAETMKE